jgi:hypothetical protein
MVRIGILPAFLYSSHPSFYEEGPLVLSVRELKEVLEEEGLLYLEVGVALLLEEVGVEVWPRQLEPLGQSRLGLG